MVETEGFQRFIGFSNGQRPQTVKRQVWNADTCEWDAEEFTLPVANGKVLVLVPAGWARSTLLMSSGRFYDTAVLSFAQMERAVRSVDGGLIKTRKLDLRKESGLERSRQTIIEATLRAFEAHEDLLAVFKAFLDSKFTTPVEDAEAA